MEMTEVLRRIYYPDLDGETCLVPEIVFTSTNSQAGSFFVFCSVFLPSQIERVPRKNSTYATHARTHAFHSCPFQQSIPTVPNAKIRKEVTYVRYVCIFTPP